MVTGELLAGETFQLVKLKLELNITCS